VETLKIGEDFFMDCNISMFAENVKMKWIFMINVPRSLRSAILVEVYGRSLKNCNNCETVLICLQCYDKSQSKVK
jgi:hypothetical protein